MSSFSNQTPADEEDGQEKTFFLLTLMAIKINSGQRMEKLLFLNSKLLWDQAKQEGVPFHKYHEWLEAQIVRKYISRKFENRAPTNLSRAPKQTTTTTTAITQTPTGVTVIKTQQTQQPPDVNKLSTMKSAPSTPEKNRPAPKPTNPPSATKSFMSYFGWGSSDPTPTTTSSSSTVSSPPSSSPTTSLPPTSPTTLQSLVPSLANTGSNYSKPDTSINPVQLVPLQSISNNQNPKKSGYAAFNTPQQQQLTPDRRVVQRKSKTAKAATSASAPRPRRKKKVVRPIMEGSLLF